MAEELEGIKIVIDGDTRPITEAIADMNKKAKSAADELKDVNKLLQFDSGNAELVAQKQQILQQQIAGTADTLESLKTTQQQVQAQFERGELGAEQHRALQREVLRSEQHLAALQVQLQEMGDNNNIPTVSEQFQGLSQESKTLVKDLKRVEAALEIDPGNTELVEQRMRNLAEQAQLVDTQLQNLQTQKQELDAAFASGDMGQAEFDRLRLDIITSEQEVRNLGQALRDIDDTTSLNAVTQQFKSLRKESKTLENDFKQINDALQLNPGNTQLLEQRMRNLAEQAQLVDTQLQNLRSQQQQLDAAFASGDMGQAEFDRLSRDIITSEQQVRQLGQAIQDIDASDELAETIADFKNVSKAGKDLEKDLKRIEAALEIDPGNTELIEQRMRNLADQAGLVRDQLQSLQLQQQQLDTAFANGKLGQEEFDRLRLNIITSEQEMRNLDQAIRDAGDTTSLKAVTQQFKNVSQQGQKLVADLAQIEQALEVDPGNTVLLEQRMRNLADQTQLVQVQMQSLQTQQQQLDAAFANGDMGQAEYDRLRRDIILAEQQVNALDQAIRDAGTPNNLNDTVSLLDRIRSAADEAESAVGKLGGALSGLAVGMGVGSIIEKALDVSSLNTAVDVSFNVPEESTDAVKESIRTITTYGVEAEEALEGARRQFALNGDASVEANSKTLELAATMAKTYSQLDFTEIIQETNEIASELEITNDAALELADNLLKGGFPPEQLDIIAEYGNQLKQVGYDAEAIEDIMMSAAKEKPWNIDNLLDGLKEGRIRAVEFSQGLSDSFKDSIRKVTNTIKPATDEVLDEMKDAAAAREEVLEEANSREEELLQKGGETRLKAATESYEKQTESLQKNQDKQLKSAEENLDSQQKAMEKAQAREIKQAEATAKRKIELIDKEYMERIKLVDEDRYRKLKGLDDEIKGIESAMEAEEKRAEMAETKAKRRELADAVANARSSVQQKEAMEALAAFDEEQRRKRHKEERKGTLDRLKIEKDSVNELADEKIEGIESEYDAAKNRAQVSIDAEREAIAERQTMEKESFTERRATYLESVREQNNEDLKAFQKLGQAKLASLSEFNKARLDAVKDANQAEMDALKELNEKRIDSAENPADSEETKATIKQLENWGAAIAKGGDEGTAAMREMVEWLDQIDDAALKKTIGVGIFGTPFEDQGQTIIDTYLNIGTEMDKVVEKSKTLEESMDAYNDDPLVGFKKSMVDLLTELEPVLEMIADIVGDIGDWISENPKLAATIVEIVTAIGLIAGVLLGLGPIIGAIRLAFVIVSAAIAGISAPVGIAVAVIAALIAVFILLKDNWDMISDKAREVFTFVTDFISEKVTSIIETITGWLDWFDEKTGGAFTSVTDTIREALTLAGDTIDGFVEVMHGALETGLGVMKDLFSGNFGDAYDKVKENMDNVQDYIGDTMNAIIEFLSGIDLFDIGGDIIKGLMNGLESADGPLADIMRFLADHSVIAPFMDKMDMHSPSKLFEKFGVFTGEGLVNGLKSMGSRVANASESMARGTFLDPNRDVQLGDVNGGTVTAIGAAAPQPMPQIIIQNMNVRNEQDIERISIELEKRLNRDKKGR